MPYSSKIHCFRSTSGKNIDRKCRQKVEKDVFILNLPNWPCQKHFPATSGQSGSHQKFLRNIWLTKHIKGSLVVLNQFES